VGTRVPERGVDLNGDGDGSDAVLFVYDARTATAHNLGRAGTPVGVTAGRLLAMTDERTLSGGDERDWNGDGDRSDHVLELFRVDAARGVGAYASATALRRAGPLRGMEPIHSGRTDIFPPTAWDEQTVAFGVDEPFDGQQDLNGDGDALDHDVLHLFDVRTGGMRNLGISGTLPRLSSGKGLFLAYESSVDRNGDGDQLDHVLAVLDVASASVSNVALAIAPNMFYLQEDIGACLVSEAAQGATDLNGDGDASDSVLFVLDIASATATNTGVSATHMAGCGTKVVLLVPESEDGVDLNADGDALDIVFHRYDLVAGTLANIGQAAFWPTLAGKRFALLPVREAGQGGVDYTGDGDSMDSVCFIYDSANDTLTNTGKGTELRFSLAGWAAAWNKELGSHAIYYGREPDALVDWNGDGDMGDNVLFVLDGDTGLETNLGLAPMPGSAFPTDVRPQEDGILFTVSELAQSLDLNGDGDTGDTVYHYLTFP
jgi:hypothetical protein